VRDHIIDVYVWSGDRIADVSVCAGDHIDHSFNTRLCTRPRQPSQPRQASANRRFSPVKTSGGVLSFSDCKQAENRIRSPEPRFVRRREDGEPFTQSMTLIKCAPP